MWVVAKELTDKDFINDNTNKTSRSDEFFDVCVCVCDVFTKINTKLEQIVCLHKF